MNNVLHSPLGIGVLLHCYTTPTPIDNWDNEPTKKTIEMLLECGAIEIEGQAKEDRHGRRVIYRATPLGKAWVTVLCNTPPPQRAFIDQQGNVIKF